MQNEVDEFMMSPLKPDDEVSSISIASRNSSCTEISAKVSGQFVQ